MRQRLAPPLRPSPNPLLCAVHVRQRRLDEVVHSIATQLRLVMPVAGWTPATLVEAIAALPRPPVLVLDALVAGGAVRR